MELLTKSKAEELYSTMLRIRRFEERVGQHYAGGEIPGFIHLYIGEEATAAGICGALDKGDLITSTHRGHGHCIAKGGNLDFMMAELFGRSTGYCKGKGGSMHIADLDIGILGANGIVGGGIPIAVGAALGIKYKNSRAVAVAFFGDGATNIGSFHESCNLASVWELPVVFVCENNLYAQTTPISEHQLTKKLISRGAAYDMPCLSIDGNDVVEVYEAALTAVERARKGSGPTFVECKTYRWHGHWEGDPQPYRTRKEVEEWRRRCPIQKFKRYLSERGILSEDALEKIESQIQIDLDEAVEFARKSAFPEPSEALDDIYTEHP